MRRANLPRDRKARIDLAIVRVAVANATNEPAHSCPQFMENAGGSESSQTADRKRIGKRLQ